MDQDFFRKLYLGGLCILIAALSYYQVLKGDYYLKRAEHNYVRVIPIRSLRGNVYDRNGALLAYDKASFNIAVIPHQIRKQKDTLFKQIAEFIDIDQAQIAKSYKKNLLNYFSPVNIIGDIEKTTALETKAKFSELIIINPEPKRFYPISDEASHLLGYVKKASAFYDDLKQYGYMPAERVGFNGIEQYYDAYLRGSDGGDLIEVDASGRMVGFLGQKKSYKGQDITLTINIKMQEAAYKALEGKRGAFIIMNSNTGEVLALVSSPGFDTNKFISGRGVNKYFVDKAKPLLNRVIQSTYALGSTFKPMLAVAALEEKKMRPSKTFLCSGAKRIGRAIFRCAHIHGEQDLYEGIQHSCNVYFYNVGLLVGPDLMSKWAHRFGLDKLTDIDLPYEKKGIVPSPAYKRKKFNQSWYAGDTLNFSIGQGFVEATPIELLVAINAIANGGYIVRPHLLKSIDGIESTLQEKTFIGLDEDVKNEVIKGMRLVVSEPSGTAHYLKRLGLGIAGKTGTAQNPGPSHGWFVGFFPYNDPQYTFCVLLESSGSSHHAVRAAHRFFQALKRERLL